MEDRQQRRKKLTTLVEHQQQDDLEEENEKIEKFFTIIRRLRDARSCSTNSLRELEARKMAKKGKKIQVWTPSFQLEDFADLESGTTRITQSSSSSKEGEKEKKEELDLNLTL